MQWDDLNWDRTTYSAFGAYQQSKLANVLFSAGFKFSWYNQQSQKAQQQSKWDTISNHKKLYQQSKLTNVLFSAELARRLEGTGVGCSGQSPISSMNIVHIICPFSHFPTYFPIDNHKSPNLCSVSTAHIPFPFRWRLTLCTQVQRFLCHVCFCWMCCVVLI